MGTVGHLENESTGQKQGIAPVPLRVKPEPRRPGKIIAVPLSLNAYRRTELPPKGPFVSFHDFAYQPQSWNVPRRVVAKEEWRRDELFPRVGFIVTNLSYPVLGIVNFYNGRTTAKQWIKEGKYVLN